MSTTQLLIVAQSGNRDAVESLFTVVYDELLEIARRRLAGNPLAQELSSTDLVHDAYLKLIDQRQMSWRGRTHFYAIGSTVMRQILIDRARHNNTEKRGGGRTRLSLDDGLLTRRDDRHILAVEDALGQLKEIDARQAKIVEMRFFGGMTVDEVAEYFGMSKRWVEGEWTMIRAWLRRELSES